MRRPSPLNAKAAAARRFTTPRGLSQTMVASTIERYRSSSWLSKGLLEGADIVDFLDAGATSSDLIELIAATPAWFPGSRNASARRPQATSGKGSTTAPSPTAEDPAPGDVTPRMSGESRQLTCHAVTLSRSPNVLLRTLRRSVTVRQPLKRWIEARCPKGSARSRRQTRLLIISGLSR